MRFARIVLVIGSLACSPAVAQDTAKPETSKPAETQPAAKPTIAAERRVWIQGVERADMQQRLFERAVAAERPRAILGIDEETAREIVRVRVDEDHAREDSPDVAEHLVIRVQLEDAGRELPQKADEFLDALMREFQAEVRQAWAQQPELTRARDAAEETEARLRQIAHEIRRIRENIAQATGRLVDATAADTRAAWAQLDQERQRLEMERVGKEARQRALVQAMQDVSADLSGRAAEDAVAEELEKVVAVREHAYENAKRLQKAAAGAISHQDVLEAQGKLAEAKARVLERRDIVLERNGGTILVDLNRELQSVIVTVAETEARLKAAERALSSYKEVAGQLEQLQQMEAERELQSRALIRARDVLAETLQKNPAPQVIVKLSHSEPAPEK